MNVSFRKTNKYTEKALALVLRGKYFASGDEELLTANIKIKFGFKCYLSDMVCLLIVNTRSLAINSNRIGPTMEKNFAST
jgi:hypothetical protein